MRKALTSFGSDVALVLDPPVRKALKLQPDDEVEVEVRSDALIMRPVAEPPHDRVSEAFRRVIENPQEIESVKAGESEGMPPPGNSMGRRMILCRDFFDLAQLLQPAR